MPRIPDDVTEDGSANAPATDSDAITEPRPRRSLAATLAALISALALASVVVLIFARLTGMESGPLAIVVSLSPWFTLVGLVAILFAIVARAWWLVAGASVATLACAAFVAPLFIADGEGGDTVLTVASINLSYGEADADALVALVRDEGVELLAVQELTPEAVVALREAGLEQFLPFSELLPEPGFTGTGVWSSLPMAHEEAPQGFVSQAVRARVQLEGQQVTVLAIHPAAPGLQAHAAWARDLERLDGLVGEIEGGLLLVGDFNTTRDHQAFRELEGAGLVDSADQAGAGFSPTFPEGMFLPAFVAIDHVMVRDAGVAATSARTVPIAGTDHRALVVKYAAQ